jgi:predicted HAD superfamily phosphohydrolase YqeG
MQFITKYPKILSENEKFCLVVDLEETLVASNVF